MDLTDLLLKVHAKCGLRTNLTDEWWDKIGVIIDEINSIKEWKRSTSLYVADNYCALITMVAFGVYLKTDKLPSDIRKFGEYVISFYEKHIEHYEQIHVEFNYPGRRTDVTVSFICDCVDNIVEILKGDE